MNVRAANVLAAGDVGRSLDESFYTARTPPPSPPDSSTSSKASQIQGRHFKVYKEKIDKKLIDLEKDDSKYHSELLKEEIHQVKEMMTDLKIDSIIDQADDEPDFLGLFG